MFNSNHSSICLCYGDIAGPKKPLFCVPTDKFLWAQDDLFSEEGQSLSSLTEQD